MIVTRLLLLGLVLGLPLATAPAAQKPKPAQKPRPAQPQGGEEEVEPPIEIPPALKKKREAEHALRMLQDFRLADADGSGWISFREAQDSLKLTRSEYRTYDQDADGRLNSAEFKLRYRTILARIGGVRSPDPVAPKPETDSDEPPQVFQAPPPKKRPYPAPEDVLSTYDRDKSRGLDRDELTRLFRDLQMELSADLLAVQMDPNESGELELDELGPLALLVGQRLPPSFTSSTTSAVAFEELYRSVIPRRTIDGGQPAPPLIPGPVTHFRRLDLYGDTYIDADDLRELLVPARLEIRSTTVIAAMDTSGDGRLSEAEFERALGKR